MPLFGKKEQNRKRDKDVMVEDKYDLKDLLGTYVLNTYSI
jgi:hypothetical protein